MADMAELVAQQDESGEAALREHDLTVPRINIEAFCMTADFASTMQTAAQDRRMAKAKTAVGMGGCASAVKRYANIGTPNLIVVETLSNGFSMFQELEGLSEVCDEDTRVIVAGPSNDVTLYRELIRQGVCEYLVTPAAPLQVIEAIAGAYADPASAPAGKTVAVYGVRGGVGASALCHNIGTLVARQSERETILVDLDLEFGTVALDFNADAKSSIADALGDLAGLDDVKFKRLLHRHDAYLRLLPSPASIRPRAKAGEEEVLGLLDVARFCADFLVLDLPSQWSDGVRCALRQADKVVLVAAPDLASLRNLKSVHDWISAERKHDEAPRIVLNGVGEPKRPEIAAAEFAEIIGAPVDLSMSYEPALFGAAQTDGKALVDLATARRLVEKLEDFTAHLIGLAEKSPKKTSALSSLLSFAKKR
ncbi:MAG: cellulose synthase operon protein YhjQ/BcsQ [Pseudomonadota bacterium]